MDFTIPERDYWYGQIKCQVACPVNTDARGYVRAIAEGDDELAYLIARGPNPLASICGRVCGAPCEKACRRGDYDAPVSIRALKRFVCEKFGPESRRAGRPDLIAFLENAARRYGPRDASGKEELLPLLQSLTRGALPKVEGKSVGIIGSGPAGLAAAHDLALLGFKVTIYEMEPVLAGMLAVGIPEYRLPRALIEAEVAVILAMGVEAVTECEVGKDVSFDELRRRHDAVIVAVGAKRSRTLPIPGADAEGVLGGVEFLRDVALCTKVPLGRDIVVIGGGNVAYDVARTVVRQTAIDAARSALRVVPEARVTLCSLESLAEMPADDVEIEEGDEEGIVRKNGLGPTHILTDAEGKVRAVRFQRCLRVFDENRRFQPVFDPHDVTEIPCDTVLIAIGQRFDLRFLDPARDAIELLPNGAIKCDRATGATSADGVFVAGDLAHGVGLMIQAVASGKRVARAIYERVTGREIESTSTELFFALPDYARKDGYEKLERGHVPVRPAEERKKSQRWPVELVMSDDQARDEASRCLDCGVQTIFDGSRCVLCGGCVEVCPELCLRIVPTSALLGSDPEFDRTCAEELEDDANTSSAILKDESLCIRCSLCAERCPTGAITMERFCFSTSWRLGSDVDPAMR